MNGDSASTRHYLVCGIQKDQLHREGNPLDGCLLHCQRLAPELRLPYKDEVLTFALHGDNKFRVLPADEQPHLDIPCTHFAKEWACGRADVLPSGAQLFYTVHPTCDQLSLPELASCASCSCGCLNPWSAHEHGPTELAQDSASCRYRGEAYRRGDLAWVVPPVDAEVDAELHLGHIVGFRCVALDDSETQELTPVCGQSRGDALPVRVRYQRYHRADSVQGSIYTPAAEPPLECKVSSLAGVADLPRHAPGCRLEDSIRYESGPGCSATPAGTTGPAEVVGDDATPSGSDGSANLSWSSDAEETDGDSCAASWCLKGRQSSGRDDQQGCGGAGVHQQPFAGVEIADVFCGFGGLSLGIERALPGARVRWACDLFKEALATYRNCHPEAQTFEVNACEFLAGIRARKRGHPRPGWQPGDPPRMLVGGPPCQGFSNASSAEQEDKERKNILVPLFLEILSELRWPYAIMENVVGLLSTEGTMQRIMQAAVSMGYQLTFRVLNAGSYGTAQHRRRVIVFFARHGLPMPAFPRPTTVFSGAGGYRVAGFGSATCSLKGREAEAFKRVPTQWQANVEVPRHAPLPALTCHDCLGDLPREAGAQAYDRAPHSAFAARMRPGGLEQGGAPLHNHVTQNLQADTLRRIARVPRQGAPPPPGLKRWPGEQRWVANPFQPLRSGNWQSLPPEELPEAQAELLRMEEGVEKRKKMRRWAGIFGRMMPRSHFATLTTNPSLNSHTTSTTLHWDADRPMTVRESARAQGVPDSVRFEGCTAACYKQVGNAVPVPLAEALGRELGVVLEQLRG